MSDSPSYCPGWEYKDVTGHQQVIAARTEYALRRIRLSAQPARLSICCDTRPFHRDYFENLAPRDFGYYAGNYRGSNFPCLLYYRVGIQSDPRVGHAPGTISMEMASFERQITLAVAQINQAQSANVRLFSEEEKLYRTVEICASLFVYFLEIHPYANGNGHMARLILICLLANHNIYLSRWSIDPRPQEPQYSLGISDYRSGKPEPLITFILSCI